MGSLVILILIGAVALWFLLSFAFVPFGKFLYRIFKDAMDEINKKEEEKEKTE